MPPLFWYLDCGWLSEESRLRRLFPDVDAAELSLLSRAKARSESAADAESRRREQTQRADARTRDPHALPKVRSLALSLCFFLDSTWRHPKLRKLQVWTLPSRPRTLRLRHRTCPFCLSEARHTLVSNALKAKPPKRGMLQGHDYHLSSARFAVCFISHWGLQVDDIGR